MRLLRIVVRAVARGFWYKGRWNVIKCGSDSGDAEIVAKMQLMFGHTVEFGRPLHDEGCDVGSVGICTCGLLLRASKEPGKPGTWLVEEIGRHRTELARYRGYRLAEV